MPFSGLHAMGCQPPTAQPSFGDLLLRSRRAAGLTQEALAEKAGVSARGISDLERGVHAAPRRDTLVLILDALDLEAAARTAMNAAARRSAHLHAGRTPTPAAAPDAAFPKAPLPRYLDTLIGRERDLAALSAYLLDGGARLLTLTGPGGAGKTRLAVAAAEACRDAFPDGVAFVPLAAVRDPDFVVPAIAQALGVREMAGQPLDAGLARALAGRRVLLVLDNMEQLLAAGPRLARLAAAAPSLTVLVSSRAPLRVAGEVRYPVPPLPLASPAAAEGAFPALADNPAITLFVRRARDIDPSFALTHENAVAVAGICERLDGVPLAIELAAARSIVLPPGALLRRLDHALPVLTGGSRDAPERQRTLRDAIAWSYELLAPGEQRFFRRLGVFASGFTLEAAEAVAGEEGDPATTLDHLTEVIEQSLVQVDAGHGAPRYRMLEAVREFAAETLAETDEREAVALRHAMFVYGLAQPLLADARSPVEGPALQAIAPEIGNVRAALETLLADPATVERAAELVDAVSPYWYFNTHYREGLRWHERLLAQGEALSAPARARALGKAALYCYPFDDPRGDVYGEEAIALQRGFAGTPEYSHRELGRALCFRAQMVPNPRRRRTLLEESLDYARLCGDLPYVGYALSGIAHTCIEMGRAEEAVPFAQDAVAVQRRAGGDWSLANALMHLGHAYRATGRFPEARAAYHEAIAIQRGYGELHGIAVASEGLAAIAALTGRPGEAAWLFGAAANLRVRTGAAVDAELFGRSPETIAGLGEALGIDGFATAHAAGEAAPAAQKIERALAFSAR